MAAARVSRTDNVVLVCRAADNAVHAYLNGSEVYARDDENHRQDFNDETRLAPLMQDGYNVLSVLGVRWANSFNYNVQVEVNGNVVASHIEPTLTGPRNPNGIAWDFAVEFNMVAA